MVKICGVFFSLLGFELYSMVPSICPLETLHNSLSLKQVDEFLASITASTSCENFPHISTASFRNYLLYVLFFKLQNIAKCKQFIKISELAL